MTITLVVEDGSGRSTSNTYLSADDFAEYQVNHGRDVSGKSADQQAIALIKATEYVDQRFDQRYRGDRQTSDQALSWPRVGAEDNSGYPFSGERAIPKQLKNAIAEYAWIVINLTSKELLPNPAPDFTAVGDDGVTTAGGTSGRIIRKNEVVGSVEEDTWYEGYNGQEAPNNVSVKSTLVADEHIPEYPRADLWIEQVIEQSTNITLCRGD